MTLDAAGALLTIVHRLRTYDSPIQALVAATFLWRSGVPAGVFASRGETSLLPIGEGAARRLGRFELMIASRDLAPRALALLSEMDDSPPEFDPAWERTDALPDLARIDPALAPPCPACGELLPLDAACAACPACCALVDIAGLIVADHGPEALADAYDHTPVLPEDIVRDAPVRCSVCTYFLAGLPIRGVCPECGQEYEKHELIQYWFG